MLGLVADHLGGGDSVVGTMSPVLAAAISVAGPISRVKGGSLRRFCGPVTEAANMISRRLGYRG